MSRGLATLTDAVDWLERAWDDRDTPLRLHDRGHEGWGPPFTPAFARHLDARPDDTVHAVETRDCRHQRLATPNSWECPDCAGSGFYETTTLVYRYPTWRAMNRLLDRSLSSWVVIVTFVHHDCSMPESGIPEPVLLRAIRRMYDCYERAPAARVKWVDKSASQQLAEGVLV